MIKGSVIWEDKTMLNAYVPNKKGSKCMEEKWIKLKREINKSTIVV